MTPDRVQTTEADLDFAERIVRKGFGTPEEAAEMFCVSLAQLRARLAREPHAG